MATMESMPLLTNRPITAKTSKEEEDLTPNDDLQCWTDATADATESSSSLVMLAAARSSSGTEAASNVKLAVEPTISILARFLLCILLGIFLGALFSRPSNCINENCLVFPTSEQQQQQQQQQGHGVFRGGDGWRGGSENLINHTGVVGEQLHQANAGNIKKPSNVTSNTDEIPPSTAVQPSESRYKEFQALNFQIYTGAAPVVLNNNSSNSDGTNNKDNLNPECLHALQGTIEGEAQCYVGHENATKDVLQRLAVLRSAIHRAHEAATTNPETLKIFVAPEFFFRGIQGAYVVPPQEQQEGSNSSKGYVRDGPRSIFGKTRQGECGDGVICRILQGLQNIVADARFKDWIFLFGTIIASEELPREDDYDFLFYNFGVLLKGYDPATQTHYGKRFIIPKRYVSSSDFLTPHRSNSKEIFETARPASAVLLKPSHKRYDRNLWHKYKEELTSPPLDYIMIEYGWVQVDYITFTVEICLDHDLRSALTAFLVDSVLPEPTLIPSSSSGKSLINGDFSREEGPALEAEEDQHVNYVEIPRHQAQISLVSSAGMTVNEGSMALTRKGSIILQDGLSEDVMSDSYEYTCDYRYEWQFQGGSEVIQRDAIMTPTEVVFEYNLHQRFQKIAVFSAKKDEDGDSHNTVNHPHWKTQLGGVFTTTQYEPMIVAFEPLPIAPVFVDKEAGENAARN